MKEGAKHSPRGGMLRDFWRLVMLEGTGLVVIGIAAVILPQLATLAIDLLVGWLLFIAGLFRFASLFSAQGAPGYWGSMLLAALTALLGALLALWPTAGILTLTMVLAVYLTAHGIASLTVAGALRGATDLWFWIGLGALADFLLAGLVIAGWPSTAAWAMGLYIGINLTTSGLALILAAIAFCILMERLAAGDVSPGP
jgi:uncharacterized membrane protein HdeD (DUF308 family)